MIGASIGTPSYLSSCWSHSNSAVVVAIVLYSAYVEDLETFGCFLQDHEIALHGTKVNDVGSC